MRLKLNEQDHKNILESVNALMTIRQKGNMQISLSIDNGDNNLANENDNLIDSKDYYDNYDSSDDSVDKNDHEFVYEVNSNSEDDSADALDKMKIGNSTCILKSSNENLFNACNSVDNLNVFVNNSIKSIKYIENEFITEKKNFDNELNCSNEKYNTISYNSINETSHCVTNNHHQHTASTINITTTNNELLCESNFEKCNNQDLNEKQSMENNLKN